MSNARCVSRAEQETVIVFTADENTASVFTCDPVWRRRMEKLREKNPDTVTIAREDADGVTYTVPKKAVRVQIYASRPLTDEQRAAVAERLHAARGKQREQAEA